MQFVKRIVLTAVDALIQISFAVAACIVMRLSLHRTQGTPNLPPDWAVGWRRTPAEQGAEVGP